MEPNRERREFHPRRGSARVFAALLVLLPVAAGATATGIQWTPFSPDEGGFRVELPAVPKHEESAASSVMGKVVTHNYVANLDEQLFIINYTDLPGMALLMGGSFVYQGSRDRLLRDNDGDEVAFHDTARSGQSGKRLVFHTPETDERPALRWRAEMYLVSKRLYLVIGAIRPGGATGTLERFFESVSFEAN